MGRPPKNPDERRIVCLNKDCPKKGKPQQEQYFYNSNNELDKYPLCKTCIKALVDTENLESVCSLLKSMNYPFYSQVWDNAKVTSPTNPFGTYVSKLASLSQYKGKTWEDGEVITNNEKKGQIILGEEKFSSDEQEEFTSEDRRECIKLFGAGYPDEQLRMLKIKYDELKDGYPKGPLYKEALITYIKYRNNEEICTMNGDPEGAEKWGRLAQKQAEQAKITPKQLNQKDLSDSGLNAISNIALMVEKNIDIIPLYPSYKPGPNDLADFVIYALTERIREEKGLPPVTYEEIYAWYDKLTEEYLKDHPDSTGIISDPNKNLREKAALFLKECEEMERG